MTTIKIVYDSEIRRSKVNTDAPFQELKKLIQESYGLKSFELRYRDDEDDLCLITSEDEMKEALRLGNGSKTVKLFLSKSEQPERKVAPDIVEVAPPIVVTEIAQEEPVQRVIEERGEPLFVEELPVEEPLAIEDPPAALEDPLELVAIEEPIAVEQPRVEEEPRADEPLAIDPPLAVEPLPVESAESVPAESKPAEKKAEKPFDLHEDVRCDGCRVVPIRGTRYKCTSCEDFDLCQLCESKNEHPMEHILLKVKVALPDTFEFVSPFPKWVFADQRDQGQQPVRPKAHFVRDVSVPDGSACRPGQRVLKTWSMKNSGKVFWPRDTKLVFVGGQLSPVQDEDAPLVALAAPGEVVDVSAWIQMPQKPGRYTGYYRLSCGDGVRFGHRIWVDVLVSDSAFLDLNPVLNPVKGVFGRALDVVTSVTKVFRGEKPVKDSKKSEKEEGEVAKSKKEVPIKEAKKNEKEGEKEGEAGKPKKEEPKFAFEAQLNELKGMGFLDEKQLKDLLLSYDGDVTRVANRLLSA